MNIGIDFKATIGGGGNQQYSLSLIKGLAQVDKENKYFLYSYFHSFLNAENNLIFSENFKTVPAYFSRLNLKLMPSSVINFINKETLKFSIKRHKIDVFHFTNPINFISSKSKTIVTIHDLAPLHDKNWAKVSSWEFYQKNIGKIIKQADKIIAVSNYTKNDIINFFNIEPEKIAVIYEAASDSIEFDYQPEFLQRHYGLRQYILYVGQLQPRKNIKLLIEAYGLLPANLRDQFDLVLVGQPRNDQYLLEIKAQISKLRLENKVKLLGRIADEDLSKIYSGAKIFVYPSLLEGFGLPILEAMKCSVPVIATKSSSLPEVGGPAAVYVDPTDSHGLAQEIKQILSDESLYCDFKSRGAKQIKKFSWRKTAEETLNIYQQVFKS